MKKCKYLFICIIAFAVSFSSFSQESQLQKSKSLNVYLKDGSSVHGELISEDDNEIVLQTPNMGELVIKKANIKSMTTVQTRETKNNKYWFPNPTSNSYILGPTGGNIKKGTGYWQNIDILFNSAHYGITNWFSLGAGFEAISTFSGKPILLVMPKIGFKLTDFLSAGGGMFYVNANLASKADEELSTSFAGGLAYGVLTFGSDNNNGSVGIGYAFNAKGDFGSQPVFTLSGMTRVSRRLSIVTENWIVSEGFLLTYGLRLMSEKLSFTWALINNKEIMKTFPVGLPILLSVNYNF